MFNLMYRLKVMSLAAIFFFLTYYISSHFCSAINAFFFSMILTATAGTVYTYFNFCQGVTPFSRPVSTAISVVIICAMIYLWCKIPAD